MRERLIVECFTNNGVAGVKFREDGEEGRCLGEDQVQGERVVILLILSYPGWSDCVFPSGGWDSFTLHANQLENPELVAHCSKN